MNTTRARPDTDRDTAMPNLPTQRALPMLVHHAPHKADSRVTQPPGTPRGTCPHRSRMPDQRSTKWQQSYPELYAELTPAQQQALDQTLGSHALDGMEPDRDLVSDLVDWITGKIDEATYNERAAARAHRSSTTG